MNDKKVIEALEELNMEIINLKCSREYRLGCRISQLISAIKKGDIKYIINKIRSKCRFKKVRQTSQSMNVAEELRLEQLTNGVEKVVIYSCITGGYDIPRRPLYYAENIDYILYTDIEGKSELNGWKVKSIPLEIKNYSNTLINRYIKFHPRELFGDEYNYSVYIDGNIRPVSDLSIYTNLIKDNVGIAMHKHSTRKCIEDEMKACVIQNKGNAINIRNQIQKYFSEGFPHDFGMLECNMIVCDLNNKIAENILEKWWNELIESQSGRDQIALPYVLWENGIRINDVGVLGNSVYKNSKLQIVEHREM